MSSAEIVAAKPKSVKSNKTPKKKQTANADAQQTNLNSSSSGGNAENSSFPLGGLTCLVESHVGASR